MKGQQEKELDSLIEQTTVDQRTMAMCDALMAEPGFKQALDALAVEFMDGPLAAFIERHAATWRRHLPNDDRAVEVTLALVMGWMLGYPAAKATPERSQQIAFDQIIIATFAAGACSKIAAKSARKAVQ